MSSTSFVMPNDLTDLCRVCLQLPEESQYLDLTTIYDEEDNLTYGECFTICTQIDLSAGGDVPHNLCKSCGLELQMSYDFYKKVEESKRVIEQCQKQLEEQKENVNDELPTSVQQAKATCNIEQQNDNDVSLIEKYVASDYDEEVINKQEDPVLRDQTDFITLSENQQSNEVNEVNNLNQEKINQMCDMTELKESFESIEPSQESNIVADIEEHLDLEDYQNLEALEEEETETIQMKCGENIIPIQITKYKTCEYVESEEYVEYAEDDEGEEVEEIESLEEEEEIVNRKCRKETNNGSEESDLTWKENVVAVASKEHIPIKMKNDGDVYKNAIETIISESSQDDTMEEDVDDDPSKKLSKKKPNTIKSHPTRKRHVGSYACDFCQKIYPNYSRMKSHRRCHEADRPKFTCSYCGRMYATKQAMECHIQTAHEKSGFTCSICNKVFAIRKSLEIHVRYHTGDFPYACNLCDRKFAQACHLNTHINVKHNKIRFSCEYPNCGKFFTSSTSLRNHEFTHGVMPFECEYCQRGYPAKAKLRIHIKRKHGIDMNIDQLENMRKFHVMRSKVNLVQFVET